MAKGVLLLLALFLCATFVTARVAPEPNAPVDKLKELCARTEESDFCVQMLQPLLTPTTDFQSLKWKRAVFSKAMTRARTARSFMLKQGDGLDAKMHGFLKDCIDDMGSSVELLQQAALEYVEAFKYYATEDFPWYRKNVVTIMKTAADDQSACFSALNGTSHPIMVQVKKHAGDSLVANYIAKMIAVDM